MYIFSYDAGEDVNMKALAVVSSDGTVVWTPAAVTRSHCTRRDLLQWDCALKFGSWTYDAFLMDINFYGDLEKVDLSDYIVRQWNTVGNSAVRSVKFYPCCNEPYSDITFRLSFSRNPSTSSSSTGSNHGNGIVFLTTYVILKWYCTI